MVMQALGGPLEETNKFAKVNNEAATYDHLLEALEAKEALVSILAKSEWDEFEDFDASFCNPSDRFSANGFLSTMERRKLYRIFLLRSIRKAKDGKFSPELYDQCMEVKGLLGMTDDQAEAEAQAVFGPELIKVLQNAVAEVLEDYTPELVANLQKKVNEVVESYRLSDDYVRQVGAGLFDKAVESISEMVRDFVLSDSSSLSHISCLILSSLSFNRHRAASQRRSRTKPCMLCKNSFDSQRKRRTNLVWNTSARNTRKVS